MPPTDKYLFSAVLEIIGINPFVSLPENVLQSIFAQAGKERGPIPVTGTVNGKTFRQTLVKYRGAWRLYINTRMLNHSPDRIGEQVELSITFDPAERVIVPHPQFLQALDEHQKAKEAFEQLPPYIQKEMIRYISFLKQERSIAENILKAIGFLEGKNKFIGRAPINNIP